MKKSTPRTPRHYTDAFKLRGARMFLKQGYTLRAAATKLDVSPSRIHAWATAALESEAFGPGFVRKAPKKTR